MDNAFQQIIIPGAIILGATAALLIIRSVAFKVLRHWAERTETTLDDAIIASFRNPSYLLAIAVGVHLGLSFSGIPDRHLGYLTRMLHIIIILAVTLALSNLSGRLLTRFIQRSNIPVPATGLAFAIMKGTIVVIGFLIILSVLGISIAPLITALGVGGLAVALALQDTLANLFAGLHILMEKTVRIGDFVRLENGQEGMVDDISWRTTRIRMQQNAMVVIPNSKLAQSIVTNYSLPEQKTNVQMQVSVGYGADPDLVERILVEEAKRGAMDIPGILAESAPHVRFAPGFGESSLDFTLIVPVAEYKDQFDAVPALRKRILKRFREEGIEIPYPHRTVYLREERGGR